MQAVIGIDPGKTGGVALLDGDEVLLWPMPPTTAELVLLLEELRPRASWAVVERQQAWPGQGVVSTFRLGEQFGAIIGVLAAQRWHVADVPPATWKRALGLHRVDHPKDRARELAMQLYPAAAERLRLRSAHGLAEALLLAHWWRHCRARD